MSKNVRNYIIYAVLIITAGSLIFIAGKYGCVNISQKSPATTIVKPGANVSFERLDFTADTISNIPYGSVLIYRSSKTANEFYVSRLIGKPGDWVRLKNGQLFRNRKGVNENYLSSPRDSNFEEILIPRNYVFLLGDDLSAKHNDSRDFGPINIVNLVGKISE